MKPSNPGVKLTYDDFVHFPDVELSRDAGDVLMTPLLPGLELPLDRVVRE